MLKRYIRRENHPLLYIFTDIEGVAVENDGLVFLP
jgi:hypothetical protein